VSIVERPLRLYEDLKADLTGSAIGSIVEVAGIEPASKNAANINVNDH